MIKSIPIPTAGVSLGLAALGNLLQPYSPLMKYTCGILAAILLAMLLIKILRYPKLVHADMTGNPILGSVAATFFMTTMQLCVYIKDFAAFSMRSNLAGGSCCPRHFNHLVLQKF